MSAIIQKLHELSKLNITLPISNTPVEINKINLQLQSKFEQFATKYKNEIEASLKNTHKLHKIIDHLIESPDTVKKMVFCNFRKEMDYIKFRLWLVNREAAIIDGATSFQLFFRVKLPQIYSPVLVVWTYLVIQVLKVFDIPYALSANDDDKLLLATMMEAARNTWSIGGDNVDNLFASIAILLMLTVSPVMVFNGWRMRREQKEFVD